ncbi:hypothetical protein CgunFtcFv8_003249 [Champsocephalus gunnari]|uniref:NYN domain-containing protein n=1 Tax=Champsocephalus gunnari TaxID=52237 RepID=A0AAN8HKA4_CHAGU|nr:hypothetical protein CgunFtcFv8_003249 [Champsocephalus gunnari]
MSGRQWSIGNIISSYQLPPAQKVVLSSIENKKQLNLLLFKELTEDRLFHLRGTNKHQLVVTGEDSCPIEIRMEERRSRYELENQQEEADTIIVQQVLGCAGEAHQISVVSDDTDVFVLLLHYYHQAGLDVPLIMEWKSNSGHQGDTVQAFRNCREPFTSPCNIGM